MGNSSTGFLTGVKLESCTYHDSGQKQTKYNTSLSITVIVTKATYCIRIQTRLGSVISAKRRGGSSKRSSPNSGRRVMTHDLKIVGGRFRGRKLASTDDSRVRPMKNRVREAVFNLVGPDVKNMHALDLFAGTGALGLEALSRGADRVTMIERHLPTAQVIQENVNLLQVKDRSEIVTSDAFYWLQYEWQPGETCWLVLIAPPYRYFVERTEDMMNLIQQILDRANQDSMVVVESDERFDTGQLPNLETWDVRQYPPATVCLRRL